MKILLFFLIFVKIGLSDTLGDLLAACDKNQKTCCQELIVYYDDSDRNRTEWMRIQNKLIELSKHNDTCASAVLGLCYRPYATDFKERAIERWTKREFYNKKACEQGSFTACNNLGTLYKRKWSPKRYYPIEVNLTKALYYLELACQSDTAALEKGCMNKNQTIEMLKEKGMLQKALEDVKKIYGIDVRMD